MSDIFIRWGNVDIEDEDGHKRKELAMGITRARPGRQPIYAIPLSSAYLYNEPKYLLLSSLNVATVLGMFPDKFLINRIADLILDNLPTLVAAKPVDSGPGKAFGEGEIRIDGERVEQFEAYTNGAVLK